MPRLVKSSSPVACVRLVISTTSTPPTRTAAQSPDRHLGRAEALPGVALAGRSPRPRHRPAGRRSARSCRRSAARTSRRARRRSRAHGDRDPRSGRGRHSRPCSAIRWRRMSVLSDGAPPPALSAGSAITTGRSLKATPSPTPPATSNDGGWVLPRKRHQLLAEPGRQRIGLLLVAVGDHQHARADLGHVAIGKAVGDRDREDAVLALHRHDAVDEAAHRLQRRRIALDLPAVVDRHDRLDLAAQGRAARGRARPRRARPRRCAGIPCRAR